MYVKVYRYKIKKNALREWKRTAGKAAKIYKGCGDKGKWLVIMKKEKNFISVIDMSIYIVNPQKNLDMFVGSLIALK